MRVCVLSIKQNSVLFLSFFLNTYLYLLTINRPMNYQNLLPSPLKRILLFSPSNQDTSLWHIYPVEPSEWCNLNTVRFWGSMRRGHFHRMLLIFFWFFFFLLFSLSKCVILFFISYLVILFQSYFLFLFKINYSSRIITHVHRK